MAVPFLAILFGAALISSSGWTQSAPVSSPTEWPTWGGNPEEDHYSPLDQINVQNVGGLKPVWQYISAGNISTWETTPIVVRGVMYFVDLEGAAVAVDPDTGAELWKFKPDGVNGRTRAVSYWAGDAGYGPRILYGIGDRLYALEPLTGKPIQNFAHNGYIPLREGVSDRWPTARFSMSAPAAIYKNLAIVGVATPETGSIGPSGDPRAFDVRTGKLVWRFNAIPRPGQPNFGTWGANGWKDRSGPSTWGGAAVDGARGMVFIPIGNPADSWTGIDRPGNNLYANSIVALDAATGKYKWHFQVVHHDLFDYDLAAPPALVDITVSGKKRPVVVQTTKTGMVFILDRLTGKPVFGVEERPVPKSEIPGEHTSPTQPFPLKPPPLAKLGMKYSDITTITDAAHRSCTDTWNKLGLRDTEVFTPPRANGPSIFSPSDMGGTGGIWGGVSADKNSHLIFVTVNNLSRYRQIFPDGKGGYRMETNVKFWDEMGFPCLEPPWGELVAVNGDTGDIAWRQPLGMAEAYGDVGKFTGAENMGATLATAGGLVFAGDTTTDPTFRAYEASTGRQVWTYRLPAGAVATPMTYVGKNGRQYVVVAASRAPFPGKALIAFALPRLGDRVVDIKPAPPIAGPLQGRGGGAGRGGNGAPASPPASGAERGPAHQAPGAVAPPAPASAARTSTPPAQSLAELPPGPGREEVDRMCSGCHGLATATDSPKSREDWAGVIDTMRQRGAPGTDAQAAQVLDYLATNYSIN